MANLVIAQEVLDILYAHLDALMMITETECSNILQPLPKDYLQYAPNNPLEHLGISSPKRTDKQILKIKKENWKYAEKTRRRTEFLLKKYQLTSDNWLYFFKKENINFTNYINFIRQISNIFHLNEDIIEHNIRHLAGGDKEWTQQFSWYHTIRQEYHQIRNNIS